MRKLLAVAAFAAPVGLAHAAPPRFGDIVQVDDTITIDPIIDARLRWESVDQPATDADAVTMRLRAGVEVHRNSGLSVLIEGEAALALGRNYNAFPFAIADRQRRPQFSTVADPQNIDLKRLQIQYKTQASALTVGRQRINIDDQRWVGSVAWRQNEQTFDAVRGEQKIGPVGIDAVYATGQRTIYGIDAGPRQSYGGDFVMLNATVKLGPANLRGFAYLLDYDEAVVFANSSETYGAKATATLPLAPNTNVNVMASYARQSDYGSNPANYSADYMAAEASIEHKSLNVLGGWEKLGSDTGAANGAGKAVQTPLATLHKFNGWADLFLTTPPGGLQDFYVGAAYKFVGTAGLNAAVTFHRFDSDAGSIHYGNEWDASIGIRFGDGAILAKYADYHAEGFGLNTRKFWLQAEVKY
jgi:hypothetical protein